MSITTAIVCQQCNAPLNTMGALTIVKCQYCGTNNMLRTDAAVAVMLNSAAAKVAINKALRSAYNLAEFKTLVFDLSGLPSFAGKELKFDDLGGDSLADKTRELVLWCERRCRVNDLVEYCLKDEGFARHPLIVGILA